jgi:hypothetical membrane protein
VTHGRLSGGLAVLGVIACTLAWTTASAIQPGYSSIRDDLSALAALGAAHPWITMAGEFLLGAGIVALATGLVRALSGRDAVVGCCLLLSAGVAACIQAVAREDCPTQLTTCAARVRTGAVSWHHTLHGIASVLAFLALLAAPPVLARPFRNDAAWRDLATYSTATAIVGLALLVAYVSTAETGVVGLTQRLFLVAPLAWIAVAGMRLSRVRE